VSRILVVGDDPRRDAVDVDVRVVRDRDGRQALRAEQVVELGAGDPRAPGGGAVDRVDDLGVALQEPARAATCAMRRRANPWSFYTSYQATRSVSTVIVAVFVRVRERGDEVPGRAP
jgi:hypothetical protein